MFEVISAVRRHSRVLVGLFFVLALACTPAKSTSSDGGETNFQTSCESDAECGSYSCICGVCSVACQTNSVCRELDSAASCEQMLCGSGGVCEFTCDSDEQCAAAGKNRQCMSGRCREVTQASVDSSVGDGGATAADMMTTDTDPNDGEESVDQREDPDLSLVPQCSHGRIGHPGGVFQIFAGQDVTLRPYCLDAHEVTVLNYQACVVDGGCSEAMIAGASSYNSGQANWPLTGVTGATASAYCQWADGRLPQSAELTWAGRGEGRAFEYPWGNAPPEVSDVPQKLCWNSPSLCNVGSFEGDSTARGVFDLSGNAQELSILTSSGADTRFCRFGGAYDIGEGALKDLFWVGSCAVIPDAHSFGSLGFRCAADAVE